MNCKIIDSKTVDRSGSVVSVPVNHFSDEGREERYFGTVLHLTQDNKACMKCFEDDSVSLKEVAVLNLETEVPKKDKPKFKLRIKPVREIPPKDDTDFTETVILHQNVVSPIDTSSPGPSYRASHTAPIDYREKESDESKSSDDVGNFCTYFSLLIAFLKP